MCLYTPAYLNRRQKLIVSWLSDLDLLSELSVIYPTSVSSSDGCDQAADNSFNQVPRLSAYFALRLIERCPAAAPAPTPPNVRHLSAA